MFFHFLLYHPAHEVSAGPLNDSVHFLNVQQSHMQTLAEDWEPLSTMDAIQSIASMDIIRRFHVVIDQAFRDTKRGFVLQWPG